MFSDFLDGTGKPEIDEELEGEFRKLAAERFGAKKGFLKKAIEEAVRDWIYKNSKGVKNV